MHRLFGILMLLAACVAASELGLFASRLAADDSGNTQGVRAIIVHGQPLAAPIAITDFELATALHDEVARAQKYAEPVPQKALQGRPCLRMAVFLTSSRTARLALSELRADQADVRWAYYPAVAGQPAVIGRVRVSAAQLKALEGLGVPVEAAGETAAYSRTCL